jgi:glutamate-1-semialdehyde 2,1-aminomutase
MDLLGSSSETTATIEGTYNASPYALAAGLATFTILRDGGIERLYELGDRMRAALADAIGSSKIDACITGLGSEWMIYFRRDPPANYRQACDVDTQKAEAFREAMFHAGILEPPFPSSDRRLCISLTEEDLDLTAAAAAKALATLS